MIEFSPVQRRMPVETENKDLHSKNSGRKGERKKVLQQYVGHQDAQERTAV